MEIDETMPKEQMEIDETLPKEQTESASQALPDQGAGRASDAAVNAEAYAQTAAEETAEPAAAAEENASEITTDVVTEVPIDVAAGDAPTTADGKRRKRRRKRIDEYSLDNDIRYRGPLSYRHLRMLAWFFLIVAQIGVLLSIAGKFDAGFAAKVGRWPDILKTASDIMMPLFLIATFATILNGSRSFRSMLTLYGVAAAGFYALFVIFHERYIPIVLGWVLDIDRAAAVAMVDSLLAAIVKNGYLSFNIFIDLFLCTLLTFFLVYNPKKVFTGKKLIIFRLFCIFPIAYEVGSFVIKLLGALGKMAVSPYLFPLLTTKPPMTFLVFVAIAFFIKVRERIYRKRGKTHEEYQEFLKTKANSWQFSKYTALMMFVAGVLDLVIYFGLTIFMTISVVGEGSSDEAVLSAIETALNALLKTGLGGSAALILASPIVTLFSYSRTVKKSTIDILLPIIAIVVLVFVYLEALVIATRMVGPFADFVSSLFGQ